MSTDLLIAASALLAVIVIAASLLAGWQGWLALKQRELELALRRPLAEGSTGAAAARIELADLKERVRKLEAIANGLDL